MLRSIFTKTLRDQLRPLLWWSIGLAAFVGYCLVAYPTVRDNPAISELLASYPEELRDLLLAGSTDITSPEGYLTSYLFALFVPLMLLVYTVILGAGAMAGEEERGTLDLLLSTPASRTRALIEKLLAMIAAALVLGLVLWLALIAFAPGVGIDIPADRLAGVSAGAVILALFFGVLALAVGASTGSRGIGLGVGGGAALIAYFVHSLGAQIEGLRDLREWLPFYLYSGNNPLRNGIDFANMAVLVVVGLAAVGVALVLLRRRDLAV